MEKKLIIALAAYFWIQDPTAITGKARTEPLPEARHLAFGILSQNGIPQQRIASFFGITQSGVSKGLKNLYNRMRYDKSANYESLVKSLTNQIEV